MPPEIQDGSLTPADGDSSAESKDRKTARLHTPPLAAPPPPPSRFSIGAGLATFAAAGGGSLAAMLEGAVFSGLMAMIVWGSTGLIAANDVTRATGSTRPLRQTVRLVAAGSIAAVLISTYAGGLAALLTAMLAALLGLLLVPSVSSLIGATPPDAGRRQQSGAPGVSTVPDGLDHRGYWQVNSALGGSGMWGYGFRRAYNPITGESGEWLGPGLVRKSDDTVVRVDPKGRPH